MATIREYFDTDARALTVHKDWTLKSREGVQEASLVAKVAYDFEANAKYWYFYVPSGIDLSSCLSALFKTQELRDCRLGVGGDGVYMEMGHAEYSEKQSSATLQFT